jgi:PBP1b-binding outer membrane lipoprotein LpoB
MKKLVAMAAVLAAASLAAGCSGESDGSPTETENQALNQISEDLDTSPDSLVAEDPALGNGEAGAETGELPVVGNEALANGAGANGM